MGYTCTLKITMLFLCFGASCSDPGTMPGRTDARIPDVPPDGAPPDALPEPAMDARPPLDAGPAPDGATTCTLHGILLRQNPPGQLAPLMFAHGTGTGSPAPLYRSYDGTGVGDDRLESGEAVTIDWDLPVRGIAIILGADPIAGVQFEVTTASGVQTFTVEASPLTVRYRVDGLHETITIRLLDGDFIQLGQIDYEVCPP
jgi:hypothetical protein